MEKEALLKEVRKKAGNWLESNIDEQTREQIQYLLDNDENELTESFYRNLEFGTGGLRGIMGVGTNRMNIYTVGMATQGLCNYLLACFRNLSQIKVAIAYDCRNNSPLFAETTARIFAANGIKAYLFDELKPTPELSFAIRHFGCQSGVVITASHNPKEYNGYKVYWDDGGQIIAPHDKNIIDEVNKISSIDEIKFEGDPGLIETIGASFDNLYIDHSVGIAVRDDRGKLVLLNGNQTGSLLYYYLIRKWSENGKLTGRQYVAKTIVTTELLADIARKYGVEIFDVLTGFKFIADIMQRQEGKKEFIVGSEESYGYLAGDFVRDKDAVMSCALIAETAAWARSKGKTLYELLLDIYLEFGLYLEELTYIVKKGKSGAELIAEMMQNYRDTPPSELAGSRVVQIHDYQTSKTQDIRTGHTCPIALPKSNVLQFITEDKSKVSIRPSGTEPKIKFYFSVKGSLENRKDYPEQKAKLEQKINTLKKELGIEAS